MLTADTAAAGCRGNATMNESVAHSKNNNNNNGISDLSLSVAGRDDRQRSTDRSKQRPGLSLTTTATVYRICRCLWRVATTDSDLLTGLNNGQVCH